MRLWSCLGAVAVAFGVGYFTGYLSRAVKSPPCGEVVAEPDTRVEFLARLPDGTVVHKVSGPRTIVPLFVVSTPSGSVFVR